MVDGRESELEFVIVLDCHGVLPLGTSGLVAWESCWNVSVLGLLVREVLVWLQKPLQLPSDPSSL
jgi:hypothetical protein